MIEKCLIDKTRLIEYNRVRLYVKLSGISKLMHKEKKINV